MKYRNLILVLTITAIVVCIAFYAVDKYSDIRARKTVENIQKISRMDVRENAGGYASPINFKELKKINEDIYAWIVIPGTNVDLPVVQSKEDNTYYMNRDVFHRYSGGGTLFSENYNDVDFNDKVTVIYGHNMRDGSMLGEMRNYSVEEYFNSNNRMTVYLPKYEKHYKLIAAVPFDNRHIMLSYDFTKKKNYKRLCYDLLNVRNMNARYAENADIDVKDKIVILSTCYFGRRDMRYLIIWKEIKDNENSG